MKNLAPRAQVELLPSLAALAARNYYTALAAHHNALATARASCRRVLGTWYLPLFFWYLQPFFERLSMM
jgi:hypothetical protein